jgi:hypothetical protein
MRGVTQGRKSNDLPGSFQWADGDSHGWRIGNRPKRGDTPDLEGRKGKPVGHEPEGRTVVDQWR